MAFGTKRWLPGLAAAAAGLLACVTAHASADLPLRHWAYQDLERLTALGVIDRAMVSAKPYSRKLAARYVALQAGRIAQWWGTGFRGSLLLSGHAFALNMVKLGAQAPFRLRVARVLD